LLGLPSRHLQELNRAVSVCQLQRRHIFRGRGILFNAVLPGVPPPLGVAGRQ